MQSLNPRRAGMGPSVVLNLPPDNRTDTARPLATPAEIEAQVPLDDEAADFVAQKRREIKEILSGLDDRLLVVVGPCSIHDPVAALDYARRLAELSRAHEDDLQVVMRVYLEKPRTVAGWKGIINDPGIDGSFEVNEGLRIARQLMADITRLGLAVGTEFLDTLLGRYYADLVSWGAIGARTVESQVHRGLASGLSMPVGFKNRTDGDILVAVDAIRAAQYPHCFPTVTRDGTPSLTSTNGNDATHLVLRGGTRGPNFSRSCTRAAEKILRRHGLSPFLMVDCSHGNSGKDPVRQLLVASLLAARIRSGDCAIAGVMLESNLVAGSQDPAGRPLVYGQSITDGCVSWEATVPVLGDLAIAVRERRKHKLAPAPRVQVPDNVLELAINQELLKASPQASAQ